jgi:hypothetical protein
VRTKLIESNKPEKYIHNVRNVDTSSAGLTIPIGTPLVLNLSATPQPTVYTNGLPAGWEDGLQVVLPSTAGFAGSQLFSYGVATGPIIFQQLGETMVSGVCQASVVRATRAGTSGTNSWSSGSSVVAASNFLIIDTTNNCFITAASASTGNPVILLDNLSSFAASATNVSDTRTVLTQLVRAFIRQM